MRKKTAAGLALILAVTAAGATEPRRAVPDAAVSMPIEHGIWLSPSIKCGNATNDTIFRFDPYPGSPVCMRSYSPVGPGAYRNIKCTRDEPTVNYVVRSRTSILVDGEPYRFCPPATLDPSIANRAISNDRGSYGA